MEKIFSLDLHTHLHEKGVKPKDYWKRVKEMGLDAVAITEHPQFEPRDAFEKLLELKPKDVLLIPGSELNSEFGHLLCYGKKKDFYDQSELFKKGVAVETVLDIAKRKGYIASISHPWGFDYDSFGFNIGFKKLEELVLSKNIGVETYNGMLGNLSQFIFDTNWVVKPVNFFNFLEKNRLTKRTGVTRITSRLKNKIDSKRRDIVERCSRAIDLGEKAAFVTAGSDGHYAKRIGEGMLKIRVKEKLSNENVLEEIKKKENLAWFGPLTKEIYPGIFRRADAPFDNKEIFQGIKYTTISVLGQVKKKVLKRNQIK